MAPISKMKTKANAKANSSVSKNATQQIRSHLTIDGMIDLEAYKDHILALLFLKYLSNERHGLYQKYMAEYEQHEERVNRRLERERFFLPMIEIKENGVTKEKILADFDSIIARRDRDDLGDLINLIFEAIENHNPKKLGGVFKGIDFRKDIELKAYTRSSSSKNQALQSLLDRLSDPIFEDLLVDGFEDSIGKVYMEMTMHFASYFAKKSLDFFSPLGLSKLIAKLAISNEQLSLIQAGKIQELSVFDPTCGSGGVLLQYVQEMKEISGPNLSIYGQEFNRSTWAICRMNMYLHGLDQSSIELGDSINMPAFVDQNKLQQFDTVIGHPPFSLKGWKDEFKEDPFHRFSRGIPPSSNGDWAFISHMIESASPINGRICVIVPLGVLFRGGVEKKIRENVIRENLVDAVIALPERLLFSAAIPIAILILDRSRKIEDGKSSDILFIDASQMYQVDRSQNLLTEAHILDIVQIYRQRREIKQIAKLVHIEDILDPEMNDANLNVSRYVEKELETISDIGSLEDKIREIEIELQDVQKQIFSKMLELRQSKDFLALMKKELG